MQAQTATATAPSKGAGHRHHHTPRRITPDLPKWDDLLKQAVSEPGTIAAAYSAFHGYSLGNQMLAYCQCLDRGIAPGPIASYHKWLELKRQVQKGQKALWLCMPVTSKWAEEDEDGEIVEHTSMRFTYRPNWFVLAQTEGEEYVPETPAGFSMAAALAALDITEEPFASLNGNVMGYARERQIAVNPLDDHKLATEFHEIAHIVLGHTGEGALSDTDDRTPRDIRELEAEATAMLVLDALDFTDHAQSRGYIQSWYAADEIDETTARHIFRAATDILAAGQGTQGEEAPMTTDPTRQDRRPPEVTSTDDAARIIRTAIEGALELAEPREDDREEIAAELRYLATLEES